MVLLTFLSFFNNESKYVIQIQLFQKIKIYNLFLKHYGITTLPMSMGS